MTMFTSHIAVLPQNSRLGLAVLAFGFCAATGAQARDITNAVLTERATSCAAFALNNSAKATDVQNGKRYSAKIKITVKSRKCTITSNAIPNHDFNKTGHFAAKISQQNQKYTITPSPKMNARATALSLRYDNAIYLNGVKLDLLAAGCYGVGDGFIGCHDMSSPYRYDPLGGASKFGADEHNAHTQPNGTYHYHGNPLALFEQNNPNGPSPVIGFAADGFPIYGSFIVSNGKLRRATTSYQLKKGSRSGGPGGRYDGTFVDDWQYVAGSGDLDECNGMIQDGGYGYVVTATYPHVMGCFRGTPDSSFQKRR